MKRKEANAESKDNVSVTNWSHPGGKLLELGPESCTESELLAIVLGTGVKDKSAQQIADEILDTYHSFYGLMGVSLTELMKIKGFKEVKATKLMAVFEITRRMFKNYERM